MIDNKKITVGYAGMTHLGLNYAIAGASKGFNIIGYDPKSELVQQINNGELPVVEPGLSQTLQEYSHNIQFSSELSSLSACDILYIAPDINTDDTGKSDISYIKHLIAEVLKVLNETAILVILAQVPPGFTRKIKLPLSRLYYQVETLIFGQALSRAQQPERLIIGCNDSNQALNDNLNQYLQAFNCPILPMSYESAELSKIAINCCLVASLSVANSLSEICEKIGADWSEIVPALRLDKRIGQHAYIQSGLGLSGGNLERDLATLINLADEYGTDKQVIKAFRDNSRHRRNWPFKILSSVILEKNPKAKIAILGLTYKENTHSLKNSPAIKLLADINSFNVVTYDPVIKQLAARVNAKVANSAIAAATDADVVMIMTPWQEFRDLELKKLAAVMKQRIIIDPFKVINKDKLGITEFKYYTLGK